MPRRLHNWTYREVTHFLSENGFTFSKELGGSHQAWAKPGAEGEPDVEVELNFRHGSYPLGMLKTIIRQSSIPQERWIEWGGGEDDLLLSALGIGEPHASAVQYPAVTWLQQSLLRRPLQLFLTDPTNSVHVSAHPIG